MQIKMKDIVSSLVQNNNQKFKFSDKKNKTKFCFTIICSADRGFVVVSMVQLLNLLKNYLKPKLKKEKN